MGVGTVQNYVKMLGMQQKWQQRQQQGIALEQQTAALLEGTGQTGSNQSDQANQARRSGIAAKLKAGKRLSPSDLAWLQQNDPALYIRAKQIELERSQQKNALQICKRREQAGQGYRRFSQWAACDAVTAVRKATTASERMEISESGQMRQSALLDEYRRFKCTTKWKKLPIRKPIKNRFGLPGRLV